MQRCRRWLGRLARIKPSAMSTAAQQARRAVGAPSPTKTGDGHAISAQPRRKPSLLSRSANKRQSGNGGTRPTRYELVERVGKGSYGTVFRANDLQTGGVVAVKRMHEVFLTPTDTKRTLREIVLLRQMSHPAVVRCRDIIQPADCAKIKDIFVVFDYAEIDLAKLIACVDTQPRWGLDHVHFVLYQLLCGLAYLHRANIVHRDLKVLLATDDECFLVLPYTYSPLLLYLFSPLISLLVCQHRAPRSPPTCS